MRRISLIVATTLAIAGCAAGVAYEAPPAGPELVYVSPGVQVIADYDEPVFYSDNFYWRYDRGMWYRSRYHTGGWVIATPPPAVARIDRPRYVHYRPAGWVAHRPPPPPHRGPGPGYARTGYAPPHAGQPAPVRGYQPPSVQARPAPRPMAAPGRGFAPHGRDHRDFHR